MDNLSLTLLIVGGALALLFDLINGFHDAANSIATIVSTRVLSPRVAVLWAATFNFIALFVFTPKVAHTIGQLIALPPQDPNVMLVIVSGLVGAIVWNLITWVWALPTSSSHALVGALAGAGLASGGPKALSLERLARTLAFIPLAPLIATILGFSAMLALSWALRAARPSHVDAVFRRLQLFSAAAYALGHGGNDAQKTVGVLLALGVASGYLSPSAMHDPHAPFVLLLACNAAMALGTSFGGWRIVKTMGTKITRLRPPGGVCAELAGAITLFGCTSFGVPVSTTHTITGAIIGVGSTRRARSIRWGMAGRIVWAWVLTFPAAALVAAATFEVLRLTVKGL